MNKITKTPRTLIIRNLKKYKNNNINNIDWVKFIEDPLNWAFNKERGVYGIWYAHNKKTFYIQSTKDRFIKSIINQVNELSVGKHSSRKLQTAFNKYKFNGLQIVLIHLVPLEIAKYPFLLDTIESWYQHNHNINNLSIKNKEAKEFIKEYAQLIYERYPIVFNQMISFSNSLRSNCNKNKYMNSKEISSFLNHIKYQTKFNN